MAIAFPGESAEYRAARNRRLEQEIELRRAMEAVAAARRQLPPGGVVPQDYVFQTRGADGGQAEVRLSELFAPGKDSLVIYSMMFPRDPGDDSPGPRWKASGRKPSKLLRRVTRSTGLAWTPAGTRWKTSPPSWPGMASSRSPGTGCVSSPTAGPRRRRPRELKMRPLPSSTRPAAGTPTGS